QSSLSLISRRGAGKLSQEVEESGQSHARRQEFRRTRLRALVPRRRGRVYPTNDPGKRGIFETMPLVLDTDFQGGQSPRYLRGTESRGSRRHSRTDSVSRAENQPRRRLDVQSEFKPLTIGARN